MKYIKKINEAIIDYETQNIEKFYNTSKSTIDNKIFFRKYLTFDEISKISSDNSIEIVNYDTFYNELPEDSKHTAPPRTALCFGLVNPKTNNARIVLNTDEITKPLLDFIYHILKHENIHIQQFKRRGDIEQILPNTNDRKSYYSNKDEVMAWSHSIVDDIFSKNKIKNMNDFLNKMKTSHIFNSIKYSIKDDVSILNRYYKYIFLYAEKELEKIKITKD